MANELKATGDGSGKKIGWQRILTGVFVAALITYGGAHKSQKEIAQEASGQRPVASDASVEEKQTVTYASQLLAIRKEGDKIDESFANSFTGSHMLQPETFASPQTANESFTAVKTYCAASIANQDQFYSRMKQQGESIYPWMTAQYDAAVRKCDSMIALYRYAADPAQEVEIRNFQVALVGVDGYNKLIDAVNQATKDLVAATATFTKAQQKLRQEDGVTAADYGLKN